MQTLSLLCHTGRSGKEAAAELEALQEQQKDAAGKQAGSSADQRKQKKRARKQAEAEAAAAAERQRELEAEIAEAQWRRAAALRRSRPALLAEMAVWEKEAGETEAAAAAGIVSARVLGSVVGLWGHAAVFAPCCADDRISKRRMHVAMQVLLSCIPRSSPIGQSWLVFETNCHVRLSSSKWPMLCVGW